MPKFDLSQSSTHSANNENLFAILASNDMENLKRREITLRDLYLKNPKGKTFLQCVIDSNNSAIGDALLEKINIIYGKLYKLYAGNSVNDQNHDFSNNPVFFAIKYFDLALLKQKFPQKKERTDKYFQQRDKILSAREPKGSLQILSYLLPYDQNKLLSIFLSYINHNLITGNVNFYESLRRSLVKSRSAFIDFIFRQGYVADAGSLFVLVHYHYSEISNHLKNALNANLLKKDECDRLLATAIKHSNTETAKILLDYVTSLQWNILKIAIENQQDEIVQLLLPRINQFNPIKDDYFSDFKFDIFILAIKHRSYDAVEALFKHFNSTDKKFTQVQKERLLYKLAEYADQTLINLFKANDFDFSTSICHKPFFGENEKEDYIFGASLLHLAVRCQNYALTSYISSSDNASLKKGAYLGKAIYEYGQYSSIDGPFTDKAAMTNNTPLHYAAKFNELKSAEILIRAGADLTAKNSLGKMPVELCNVGTPLHTFLLQETKAAIKAELDQYIKDRNKLSTKNTKAGRADYKTRWGRFFGYSGQVKISSAEHLSELIDGKISKKEFNPYNSAANQGNLGAIYKKYQRIS